MNRQQAAGGVSFRETLSVWAKIGILSFGGPAGQIALMHLILVDERRWISEARSHLCIPRALALWAGLGIAAQFFQSGL